MFSRKEKKKKSCEPNKLDEKWLFEISWTGRLFEIENYVPN